MARMDARRGRPGAPARPALAPLAALALLAALAPPAGAWYKHVASPRYHTVGRASGLLMGVRRSPYLWRRQLEGAARGGGGRLERRETPWWPPLPPPLLRRQEGPDRWTSREPAARWGKRDPPRALQGAPLDRRAAVADGAALAPPLPRRDPWGETPGRSAPRAPEQPERAARKGRRSQEPAAARGLELAI